MTAFDAILLGGIAVRLKRSISAIHRRKARNSAQHARDWGQSAVPARNDLTEIRKHVLWVAGVIPTDSVATRTAATAARLTP
jgi:hypothetical protein